MTRFVIVTLLALCSVASARMAYQLPSGAEDILRARSFVETFSCEGLPYGYYADVDNNCEIFHVCLPITGREGTTIETAHFSFICGNQTVFDQESLTCNVEENAFPCSEARTLYELSNADFGVIPDEDTRSARAEISKISTVPKAKPTESKAAADEPEESKVAEEKPEENKETKAEPEKTEVADEAEPEEAVPEVAKEEEETTEGDFGIDAAESRR